MERIASQRAVKSGHQWSIKTGVFQWLRCSQRRLSHGQGLRCGESWILPPGSRGKPPSQVGSPDCIRLYQIVIFTSFGCQKYGPTWAMIWMSKSGAVSSKNATLDDVNAGPALPCRGKLWSDWRQDVDELKATPFTAQLGCWTIRNMISCKDVHQPVDLSKI